MKTGRVVMGILLIAAVVVAAVMASIAGGGILIERLTALEKDTVTLSALAAVVLLLGCRIVAGGPRRARQFEAAERVRHRKCDVYQELIDAWSRKANEIPNEEAARPQRRSQELTGAEQSLMLWGSREVIQKYALLKRNHKPSRSGKDHLLGHLLLAMRKDLGRSNFGIELIDLSDVLESSESSSSEVSQKSV